MGTFKGFFIRLCSTSDNLTHDLLNPRSNMSASWITDKLKEKQMMHLHKEKKSEHTFFNYT